MQIRLAALLVVVVGIHAATAAEPAVARVPPSADSASSGPFPLRVAPGLRYLVGADGRPFLMVGDAAWSAVAQLTRDEIDVYLRDRRSKGFNTVLVELIEHHYSDNPPRNKYGIAPFKVPGDFATPNDAYFSHAEYLVRRARQEGLLVLLAPAYVGYLGGEEGWYRELTVNGASKLRLYGRYVGARFRKFDNIIWVEGGDFDPPERNLVRAVAEGIRDSDPRALQTFHGKRGTSAYAYYDQPEPWLNVNAEYSNENSVVEHAIAEFHRSRSPFFLIEARYEGSDGADDRTVRWQAYQSVLSGSTGHVMGNSPLWMFPAAWKQLLDSPGARSMKHFASFLESRRWWSLAPDFGSTLVTTGIGSGQRAAVALTADRTSATIYIPSIRPLSIDMSRLKGPKVCARWYDPTNGVYSKVTGSPWPAVGERLVTRSGLNSGGREDWVLCLDTCT